MSNRFIVVGLSWLAVTASGNTACAKEIDRQSSTSRFAGREILREPSQAALRRVSVSSNSVICLSLRIDPRIPPWSRRGSHEVQQADLAFLSIFGAAYGKASSENRVRYRGIQILIGYPNAFPPCRVKRHSIYIDVEYKISEVGDVVFQYRIAKRNFAVTGGVVSIGFGWQERSSRAAQWDPVVYEINDDLSAKSEMLMRMIDLI